MARRAGE